MLQESPRHREHAPAVRADELFARQRIAGAETRDQIDLR
jgi:hypothetical protein